MRVKLKDLLAERSIVHPTKIETVRWSADELQIDLRGVTWWRQPYLETPQFGAITLIFRGLGDGHIHPGDFGFDESESLEDFELLPISDIGWAQPNVWSIFCSGSIPEPLRVYVRLHDYLSRQEAFWMAGDYLNNANQLSAFVEMTKSQSFLLARGPECIRALLCDELHRQDVTHNVIRTSADGHAEFLVRLGSSAFMCCDAEAEFDALP